MTIQQAKNHAKVFILCFKKAPQSLAGLAVFSILTVVASLLYNVYAGTIIDKTLAIANIKGSFSDIVIPLIIFMALLLFMSLFESVRTFFEVIYNNTMGVILDDYKYTKNLSLDTQTYIDPIFTKKKEILESNGWKITASPKFIIELLSALVPTILYIILLTSYSWQIGVLVIVSSLPILYTSSKFGKRVWNIWDDNSNDKVTWNMYRNALWGNITDIKVMRSGKYIIERMIFFYNKFLAKINKNEKQRLFSVLLTTIVEYALLISAYVILLQGIISQQFSVGAFFVITASLWSVKRSLGTTFEKIASIEADTRFIDDFISYMELQPVIKSKPNAIKLSLSEPLSIEFRDVWFKYPRSDKWIFKGLNFTITKDEDVALVGKNGAGKTTMVRLITRMYDPTKGQIFINGVPLTDIDLDDYYKMLGLLQQDFRIFEFSANENIFIGDIEKERSEAEIKKYGELAQADGFIKELKEGYKTFLTSKMENGQELSGGQLQRVAIARIFYREPKLLIMDEPTSAIDALAEEEIFNNIFAFSQNRTVIIISHRFATIKRAHRIIVINDGAIVQDGTHTTLVAEEGLYKQMYAAQE